MPQDRNRVFERSGTLLQDQRHQISWSEPLLRHRLQDFPGIKYIIPGILCNLPQTLPAPSLFAVDNEERASELDIRPLDATCGRYY